MTPKRFAYASAILALASSGVYLFVYLYRWEWNRALMAGIIFLAAEIALAAALILERMKSIERHLGADKSERDKALLRLQEVAPAPRSRFEWLKEGSDELNVFIPVLLGAGVVVSGIAWMVERIAGATAKPVLERRLADRLAPIALPAGALTGGGDVPFTTTNGRGLKGRQVAILAFTIIFATVGIQLLAAATKTMPDRIVSGTESRMVVDVYMNSPRYSAREAVTTLWTACRSTVPSELTHPATHLRDMRFQLDITPALGKNGERRLRGCIEDAFLDNIQARVVSISR
jgi:hypothetical protein